MYLVISEGGVEGMSRNKNTLTQLPSDSEAPMAFTPMGNSRCVCGALGPDSAAHCPAILSNCCDITEARAPVPFLQVKNWSPGLQ